MFSGDPFEADFHKRLHFKFSLSKYLPRRLTDLSVSFKRHSPQLIFILHFFFLDLSLDYLAVEFFFVCVGGGG